MAKVNEILSLRKNQKKSKVSCLILNKWLLVTIGTNNSLQCFFNV